MELTIAGVEQALHSTRFPGGIGASDIRERFGWARFTRDTLEAMENLLETHPTLVREQFSLIPQEQGIDFDSLTDQQRGRMPHQVAYALWNGVWAPEHVIERRRKRAASWGIPYDEKKGFTVWNATDGGVYIHVLRRYVDKYGPDVLGDKFVHQLTGETRSVADAALNLLDWAVKAIDDSDIGLLEVQEFNPKQTSWSGVTRDGFDSYFHEENGVRIPVNKEKPIAYLENQFITVQMFKDAMYLFGDSEDDATRKRAKRWKEMIEELPGRTFEHFRWDEENIWVPAVDRDEDGNPRKVKILSSVIGETLQRPELYEHVSRQIDTRHIIGSIATMLSGEEFLTPAGLRMLGKRHIASEGPIFSYQGPRREWPVVNNRVANGYDVVGFPHLAHDLRTKRNLAALALSPNDFWECLPVFDDGAVGYVQAEEFRPGMRTFQAREKSAKGQMWTMTGARESLDKQEVQGTSHYPVLEPRLLKRGREVAAYPPADLSAEDHYFVDIVE